MKVFSKPIPNPRELLETRSASHEEVNLPEDVYERVRKVLERSAVRVFESSRGFEGWDAGLLERFDGEGEGEGEG